MSDKFIYETIQKSVISAVEASVLSKLPIKHLGRTFIIPDDQKYLEIRVITNNNPKNYWGSEKVYQGQIRLILHWPILDEGVYEPLDVIGSIADFFTKTNTLRINEIPLKVYENPNQTDVIEQDKELLFPVTIPYRSFKT